MMDSRKHVMLVWVFVLEKLIYRVRERERERGGREVVRVGGGGCRMRKR